ncbi:MAG: hypothetical protein ACOX2F_00585 [bacterium]
MLKKEFRILTVTLLFLSFLFSFSCTKKADFPDSFSGNLTNLVTGLPNKGSGGGLSEERDIFSTDEVSHAVRGYWEPTGYRYDAEFIWFDPDGKKSYSKVMDMSPDWRNTTVWYRAEGPLKAGKWKVVVKVGRKYLGKTEFSVVRDRSKIPLVAQVEAFEKEKLSINEVHFVAEKIKCYADGLCDKDSFLSDVPESLSTRNVGLAISVFRNGELTGTAFSASSNFENALKEIMGEIKVDKQNPASIEVSVVHSSIDIKPEERIVAMKMKNGNGFSISKNGKVAAILPTQIARKQIDGATELLRQLSTDAGMSENGWQESKLTAFLTQDFILGEGMEETKELAFSRTIVPVDSVSREDLVKSVDMAFEWYMKNQLESGRYMYTFFPSKDFEPNDDWGLRNLNAIFVLAEIARDRKDEKMIASVKRAIEDFRSSLKYENGYKYVDWKKHRPVSSIAGTAFLLGAMVELHEPSYKEDMKMMADAIISLQEESGRLKTDFYRPLKDVDQLYYPGETLLALIRYYNLSKYEPALKTVEKAFDYYRKFWDTEENQQGPFVPWQIRAYQEAYMVTKDKRHAEFVFDLMDWMLKRYPPLGKDAVPGRQGALSTQFASTAVYSEGLSQAYALAIELKDAKRIDSYGKALKGTLGYLLGLQFKPEDAYWVKRPDKVVGATAFRPDSNELRLDATYHAISAIHYTTKLLNEKEWSAILWE